MSDDVITVFFLLAILEFLNSELRSLIQTHAVQCTTSGPVNENIEKLLEALLAGQQNMQRDLWRLADRLDSLERRTAFSAEVRTAENERPSRDGRGSPAHDPHPGSDARSKPSPSALLKRLKRGDLREKEESDGDGDSMAAAIARDGVWATLLGIRKADQRRGVEGSRLIHPSSPFFTGAPVSLHLVL